MRRKPRPLRGGAGARRAALPAVGRARPPGARDAGPAGAGRPCAGVGGGSARRRVPRRVGCAGAATRGARRLADRGSAGRGRSPRAPSRSIARPSRRRVGVALARVDAPARSPPPGPARRRPSATELVERRRRLALLLDRQLRQRGGLERQAPGDQLVGDDAQRVEVGGRPGLLAAALLGRQVGGGAEHRADLRDARLLGRLGRCRSPRA